VRQTEHAKRGALIGGGTDGNEQLTAMTGVLLIALLAVIGVTIVRIGQLLSLHLFLGFLLIGPVLLKMGSTGYRFARYYTHDARYRIKGPPQLILRLIAPFVVLTTVLVFVSGVVLMYQGRDHRDPWLLIHKVSFIVWVVFTALHILGHLPGLPRGLRAAEAPGARLPGVASSGRAGRWIVLTGALVAGVVLAIVLIPDFSAWTSHSLGHH
jgi:hypothetical protein